jgi:hypothetical protein
MRWWKPRGKRRQACSRARSADDWELVERAQRDPEAFRVLYERHFQPTYRLVFSRVQNEALANDLTARVFLKAQRLSKRGRRSRSFDSWLRTLALLTLERHRGRGPAADHGLQSAGCPAPLRPIRPTLSAAVALPLPPVDDGPGIVYALGRPV